MEQQMASDDRSVTAAATNPAGPGLQPDDSLTQAGRKVLGHHFRRMLQHEPGTRLGADSEELHDMRVATRRMRSAMRVFAPFFDGAVLRPLTKHLRRTGQTLGPVRDLDVLIERTNDELSKLPDDERADLEPLLAEWRAQQDTVRSTMLTYLNGKQYGRFLDRFGRFLEADVAALMPQEAGLPPVPGVRAGAPMLIDAAYDALLRYDPVPDEQSLDALHELRIECKRFRYTLEFFREVLGPEVGKAIREVVAVQDHLGALVDARVAVQLIEGFLSRCLAPGGSERSDVRGARHYLGGKRDEMAALLRGFPDVWSHFRRAEVGQLLAASTAALRRGGDVA
jgi:CHAD domain-containing protein